jgi:hypothetical protein
VILRLPDTLRTGFLPGTQTQVVAPKRYKVNAPDFEIEPSSEDLIKAYAAVRGVLMKQDGVGYHRPFYDKGLRKKDLNGVEIDIGRPFTEAETTKLAEIMQEYSGHGEYNPIGSDSGARLINFDYLEVEQQRLQQHGHQSVDQYGVC